jgi:signal transduction histidine kinase
MAKIPFKVSARTAKLIGQENFSNPEGAIIELVKNCYDADAKNCIVIADIKFEGVPDILSSSDFQKYSQHNSLIKSCYILKGNKYILSPKSNEKQASGLMEFFSSFNSIYIIDNGHGMASDVISNHWMVIGTGNKEYEYLSDDGRIKTGAKGIGRFALDRLGYLAEMYTVPKKGKGSHWTMDWKQFDVPNKNISEVEAEVEEIDWNLKDWILSNFKNNASIHKFFNTTSYANGTVIKISHLKDVWDHNGLDGIYKSLEALIPPKELEIPFKVHFYLLQQPKLYGEVDTAYFNDYDYKVTAEYDANDLSVQLTVTRNELDLKRVKKEFAHIFKKAKSPYDLKTLEKKKFTISTSANELLKWEKSANNTRALKKLGNFTFSFYYLKNQVSTKENYPFKDINSKERKSVIDKFGGVKIYRDSFRVRPYGDVGNDWLKLGERAAISPAGGGQRIGDWRVRPNQIAGLIKISRVDNSYLIDKSDRGSLVENESFDALSKLIVSIINEFEVDRTKILHPFYNEIQFRDEKQRKEAIRKEAVKLADKMVEERLKVEEKIYGSKPDLFKTKKTKEEKQAYEKVLISGLSKFEKPEQREAEIAQVRTLASLGLIVSSFAHELKTIKNNYDDINALEKIYTNIVPDEKKKTVNYKDGVNIIELLKEENEKIAHWVDYSLTAIRKDKRKRGAIKFDKYFAGLCKNWKKVFENRNVSIEIKKQVRKAYSFKAFEMDLNTVFNNLISNSIDSFNSLKTIRERKISISYGIVKNNIQIIYSDNGGGIPKVFTKDKDKIFLPFTTSKKDRAGNDIGTGLGMYLVKNVISDNNGSVEIMESKLGFQLKIELPTRTSKK